MKKLVTILVASMVYFCSISITVDAQGQGPKEIFAKKYPNETIRIIKTADLNNEKKMKASSSQNQEISF
ncbi:hypothetical protein [Paenibacillus sp. FSL M7-1046]|uniref:hypothetical protein n=1 Tax=Paenibacillus sp. FSL M7-1046 TaxID=2975315 RepID=UPI0030FC00F4